MLVRAAASHRLRPAVIMLHGYTGTPEGEEAVSGWTALMQRTDVLVAYPKGTPTPEGGFGWATGAALDATTGADDIQDLVDIVGYLTSHDCVDSAQILVAGESNGSGLGLVSACDPRLTGKVRLFALAIPAVDSHVTARCTSARPFPLLVIASLLDQTVPYAGPSSSGGPTFTAPLTWFTEIATSVEGCTQSRRSPVPDGSHYSYAQCRAPDNFYEVDDGHHTWPGGPVGAGGLSPGVFPAAKVAWCASGVHTTPPPVSCAGVLVEYGLSNVG